MSRSTITILLIPIAVLGHTSALLAGGEPAVGQVAQEQDPVNPPEPLGFIRRDAEEADRWVEEQRARWRAEDDARAKARKQRERDAGAATPSEETH